MYLKIKKVAHTLSKTAMLAVAATCIAGAAQAQNGFTVDAADIGAPAADGISGTITNTGGSSYRVRSMGGTWWMIQNADKQVSACTNKTIDRGSYGRLYSWNCAPFACPPGWILPSNNDFTELFSWLTLHDKWSEWNSGFALAGYGNDGRYHNDEGLGGHWWSSSPSCRRWYVGSGDTGGSFYTFGNTYSFSVRCKKSQ